MIEPAAKAKQLANLKEVQRTLVSHYPDSKALRGMLRTIDAAAKSMDSWSTYAL